MKGPYDHYDDLGLLLRYAKLAEDYDRYFLWPCLAGVDVPQDKSLAAADKIDRVVAECHRRGLMAGEYDTSLTEKGKDLRPWAHPSLDGKFHVFDGHARREDGDAAKWEAIRLRTLDETNRYFERLERRALEEKTARQAERIAELERTVADLRQDGRVALASRSAELWRELHRVQDELAAL